MELTALEKVVRREMPGLALGENQPLSQYTSFAIGGAARLLAEPDSVPCLERLYRLCLDSGVKPVLLGSGTNVLAPDEGLDALVIRTRKIEGVSLGGDGELEGECGATMARLASFAAKSGVSGLEFAHGIPGSVGGGVLMNAGAYGGEIKDVCRWVRWLTPDGDTRIVNTDEAGFGYRTSIFEKSGGLVLAAGFKGTAADPEEIFAKMAELGAKRRGSQPLDMPSAGSTFKRPVGGYAAALIDKAGLKGYAVGGAQVSEKHAGFVINRGGATCADVLALMEHIKKVVFDSSGIELEPEVRLLGEIGEKR